MTHQIRADILSLARW